MRVVTGDVINLAELTDFDVIVHGCNCFCTWGAGIAKTLRDRYPHAYARDCTLSQVTLQNWVVTHGRLYRVYKTTGGL